MTAIGAPWAGPREFLWKGNPLYVLPVVRLPRLAVAGQYPAMITTRLAGMAAGSWPTILALLGTLGLGGMLKSWLDYRRGMRKQTDDMATAIVHQLSARVKAVEDGASQERALCEAQLGVLRHRVNNLAGSFDGLLLLIEMAPDKASEFVARIKQQRAAQEIAEAAEKAAVMQAQIVAARGGAKAPNEPSA